MTLKTVHSFAEEGPFPPGRKNQNAIVVWQSASCLSAFSEWQFVMPGFACCSECHQTGLWCGYFEDTTTNTQKFRRL